MRFLSFLTLSSLLSVVSLQSFGQAPVVSANELGETFVTALSKKKFKDLEAVIPGVEQWRELSPDQTEGMTDEAVENEIKSGNIPKLHQSFQALVHAAKKGGLKIVQIEFNESVVQRFSQRKSDPVGLEVLFFYDHYHDKFHLTAVELGGAWYLLEIREAESAFTNVRPVESEGPAFSLQLPFKKNR